MEPKYVLILDFCIGCLNIIKLTDEVFTTDYYSIFYR